MGMVDSYLTFSSSQALTATAASTNVIDLGADRNIGIGEAMAAVIVVDVALDDADGNETYAAVLQTDSDVAFGSATTVATFPTMTRGDAAGTRYIVAIPPSDTTKRYLRINYTLGGTSPTGTVTAFVCPASAIDNYYSNPDNYTITT